MTAVTNWLEGEQGSELEKVLEVNEKWNFYTLLSKKEFFTQLTSVYAVVVPKCRCYLEKKESSWKIFPLKTNLQQQPLPLPLLLPPPIVRVNKSVSGSCSDQAEVEIFFSKESHIVTTYIFSD